MYRSKDCAIHTSSATVHDTVRHTGIYACQARSTAKAGIPNAGDVGFLPECNMHLKFPRRNLYGF